MIFASVDGAYAASSVSLTVRLRRSNATRQKCGDHAGAGTPRHQAFAPLKIASISPTLLGRTTRPTSAPFSG